jgi:hypothetical protein
VRIGTRKFWPREAFTVVMGSSRLVIAALALVATVLMAGCGSGRNPPSFGAGATPAGAVQAAPTTQAPPVVVAGPDRKVLEERDAASAAAAAGRAAAAKAEADRKAARDALSDERAKAARARERAATREAALRQALAAKARADKRSQADPASPKPVSQGSQPIGASDVDGADLAAERDRRSDAEARAAVVRFHELLDERDARSCDLLTTRLLTALYGTEADALDRCRAAVRSVTSHVSVVISESRAHGRYATVAVVSRMGDSQVAQTLHLVLVDGTWLIDAIERKPAS